MNYYNEIKNELVNNEINRKVKNYSINKSDLDAYYNVGRMLSEAGNHYGEGIIKEYSKRLTYELGKGNLWLMLKFYELNEKVQTLSATFEKLYRIVSYFLNFFDYTLGLNLQSILMNTL